MVPMAYSAVDIPSSCVAASSSRVVILSFKLIFAMMMPSPHTTVDSPQWTFR